MALITCSECLAKISDRAETCPKCGSPTDSRSAGKSDRSRAVYIGLALFLGWIGIHNFYAGRGFEGLIQILVLAICAFTAGPGALFVTAVWAIINICTVSTDGKGLKMR